MIESNRPHLHLVSVCRLNQTVKVQISLHDSCTLNPIDIPSESELIHAENSKPELLRRRRRCLQLLSTLSMKGAQQQSRKQRSQGQEAVASLLGMCH